MPFVWTLRLFVPWLFTTALVLAIYVLWDRRAHAREAKADLKRDFYEVRRLRLAGKENLALLGGVLGSRRLPGRALAGARDRRALRGVLGAHRP